jgi:hypothetical protein
MLRRTQAALLKSRLVLNSTLKQPKVRELSVVKQQSNAVAWLEKSLHVDFPENGEILRVGMSGPKPEELAALINAVIETYMEVVFLAEDSRQLDRIAKLKEVSNRYEEQLRARRRAYNDLTESAGTNNEVVGALQQETVRETLTAFRKELIRVKLAKVAARAKLARQAGNNLDAEAQKKRDLLNEEIALLAEHEKLLQAEIKGMAREIRNKIAPSVDLDSTRDEIEKISEIAKRLRDEVEAANVEAGQAPRIQIIQKAEAASTGK